MAIHVVNSVRAMQERAEELRRIGTRIAVVPTMGYLHEGHLSLIRIARQNADTVVTTLFVNPTQFGPSEDFSRYPRNFDRDRQLVEEAGCDILFVPPTDEMYPNGYLTFVNVEGITDVLEGRVRPGHFRGVATVVAKLFNIVKPHVAVFGQKDAQQVAVIRQMTRDLNFVIRIIVAPIVREPDGLAMSSRNTYLDPQQRKEAVVLSQSLQLAEKRIGEGIRDSSIITEEMKKLIGGKSSGVVDYISVADNVSLREVSRLEKNMQVLISLAVRFGTTRLIDNNVVTIG